MNTRSAALLAPNPALAAILSQGLQSEGIRTGVFDAPGVAEVLRLAAIEAVVVDADATDAVAAAQALRGDAHSANRRVILIALSRDVAATRASLMAAGIDAVMSKPVSGALIADEIARQLRWRRENDAGSEMPVARQYGGNVVSLFPR